MKRITCVVLLIMISLFSATVTYADAQLRNTPQYINLAITEVTDIFEVIEDSELNENTQSNFGTDCKTISMRSTSLYDGYYDGMKLVHTYRDKVTKEYVTQDYREPNENSYNCTKEYIQSRYIDTNGNPIVFVPSKETYGNLLQPDILNNDYSKFIIGGRMLYHNGYHFICSTATTEEAYQNMKNRVLGYTHLYDTVNNVMYAFRGFTVTKVNDDGTVVAYEYDTEYPIGYEYQQNYGKYVPADKFVLKFKSYPIVSVFHNGNRILFDQLPVIDNGRTLVPLRAIFEKLNAEVKWDGETRTVTASKGDTVISLTIDSKSAKKNGADIILETPAKIINGRTMVPVRFVSDCFGVKVEWNGATKRVTLTDSN